MSEKAPNFEENNENSEAKETDFESMTREEVISYARSLEEEIKRLQEDLIHDRFLKNLKTKEFFDEELAMYLGHEHAEELRKEGYIHASVLFCDIDNFKSINDDHTHLFADEVLQKVATTITEHVRENDIVARWGGEEIAVLLLGANEHEAKMKAEILRRAIEEVRIESKPDFRVTMSIGVAECTPGITSAEVVENADTAMLSCKRTGKNKVVTFSELNT